MSKKICFYILAIVFLSACNSEPIKFTIKGSFKGGEGKYIKYIDMTRPGLTPDSLLLDMGGNFEFSKNTLVPHDYIFYFKNNNHIRIIPGPNEVIQIKGNAKNLIQTYSVSGSIESENVQKIIKRTFNSARIIDTLNTFYMNNQLNPELDSIVVRLTKISDSIFNSDKKYFERFIKKQPGSLSSYIALSQKLDKYSYFLIEEDLKLFEMVDTALANRYDTIPMVKMLNAYVLSSKSKMHMAKASQSKNIIGTQAPEIDLPNVYGDSLRLSALKGKYVLVDFWGSWCRPCRLENKNLRNIYRKYRYKGFEIFQVAIERNKADWKNTLREDRLYWKYQVSELNYMKSKTARDFKVKEIPSNFLVDREGMIIAMNLYGDDLDKKLDELLNAPAVVQNQNSK